MSTIYLKILSDLLDVGGSSAFSLRRFILFFSISTTVLYGKGSAPIYEDPFDIAAGGASLTRASQAGMMFSNPALIPYGPGFHRWAGNETTFMIGKDSVEFAQSLRGGSSSSDSTGESSGTTEFIDKVMKSPIHAGVLNNFAYINRFFGFSTFNRGEFDISAKKFGDTGLPALRFRAESYQGVGLSVASFAPTQFLSLGVTGKYLYAGEPDLAIELTDQEAIQNLQSSSGLKSLVGMNTGIGYDAGMLLFAQGMSVDYRLALKVDDFGGTKMTGDASLKELKQMYSAGLGLTLHNSIDAIHLSVDYRDIQNAYQEEKFKRIRVGSKYLLRRHLGVALGYYDGWPSYGLELDAWLIRLSASYYTREFGSKPGIDPRPIYALGFTMGM
jgi:hypothetical protein